MLRLSRAQLAAYLDAALLKAHATPRDVAAFCRRATRQGWWAVDLNPANIAIAKRALRGSPVRIVSTCGFPLGANTAEAKAAEAARAVRDGADEIDMVMNIGRFRVRDYRYVRKEISQVVRAARGRPVKVIIEVGYLTKSEIVRAARLAVSAGAAFVKDTSGWGPVGAEPANIRLIRAAVGPYVGVKASGGIRSTRQALALIEAGATRIGTSSPEKVLAGAR